MDSSVRRLADLDEFLKPYRRVAGPRYRTAPWLLNSFFNKTWLIRLDTEFQINWEVEILDAGLLTSPHNEELLEAFRSWLIAQSHVDLTGGKVQCVDSIRSGLQRTLFCIDYFLLNASALKLGEHALGAVTSNDIHAVLARIAASSTTEIGFYEWPKYLAAFLRLRINELTDIEFDSITLKHSMLLEDLPDRSEFLTDLTPSEVIRARAWLFKEGFYGRCAKNFKFSPSTRKLARLVYRNTLWGCQRVFTVPEELGLVPEHRFTTEYPRARVVGDLDSRMTKRVVRRYIRVFESLLTLRSQGISVPNMPASFSSIYNFDPKCEKRFQTLPHEIVLTALRRALEYVIEYGDPLVDSYLSLARGALASGQSVASYARVIGLTGHLHPKVAALGVESWTIEPLNAGMIHGVPLLSKEQYFDALRGNRGLYESIRVLYGAVSIIVGTLMARRQGELEDLVAGKCFDSTNTRLLFRNRKSGFRGLRKMEARPIPQLGVKAIRLLERLQNELVTAGVLDEMTTLFSFPKQYGEEALAAVGRRSGNYNVSIDYFCDWSEVTINKFGNRPYIRQHQLRRFFAMLFFWGDGFGGMDTLRWFLSHTDLEHLWHYITEFTPGATIRSVAAEWTAYGVQHASREAEILGEELAMHFGTNDFSVIEEAALVQYLEDLMEEGRLHVEPHFLDMGRNYRIAVVLDRKETIQ